MLEGVGKCWNTVGRCWTVGRLDEKFAMGKMFFAFFFEGGSNENFLPFDKLRDAKVFINGNGWQLMVVAATMNYRLNHLQKKNL
ncbi:MAG: hypothetical protein ABFD50_12105 [Smithella sp.]